MQQMTSCDAAQGRAGAAHTALVHMADATDMIADDAALALADAEGGSDLPLPVLTADYLLCTFCCDTYCRSRGVVLHKGELVQPHCSSKHGRRHRHTMQTMQPVQQAYAATYNCALLSGTLSFAFSAIQQVTRCDAAQGRAGAAHTAPHG